MKKSKNEKRILNPKKTFSYKTYEKNFVLLKKFAYKSILRILKKRSGEKVRARQNPKKRRFP